MSKKQSIGIAIICAIALIGYITIPAIKTEKMISEYQTTEYDKLAHKQVSMFEDMLDVYRLHVGEYPTTEQGLQALRVRPDGVDNWRGPYSQIDIPLDPWGNPYQYERLSPGEYHIGVLD